MLECFVTMNWLIVSLMVLLFPRNGNLNAIKDELPSKNFDLNGTRKFPFESISDVSNRQWYGGRHLLFGVLQGRVPTSKSSTLKPMRGFTTNLPTSLRNLNDERVLKKKLSRKKFDLNAAKKLPGVLLSDVSNRQLYGGRHLLFGVLQGNLQTSETSTLKPVARFVTNFPTIGYFNDKRVFKSNKILNRKNLSVSKTFNPVSNATNLLQSSISNAKSSSPEHNNIQFADDNSRPLNILAPQRVEASENAKETDRTNILTTENSEIHYNLKAEDLQSRLNSSPSTTTTEAIVHSQVSPKMVASNSTSSQEITTNYETSLSSDYTSTPVATQYNTMTIDSDTSVSPNNTITPNTTQYSTMTSDFKTSASTHSSSIHVTTGNSTMTPTKCPCTDQPGLVAGIVVAVMCFIVILFTGTFFLIKRRWRDDPESQPLLR